MRQERANQVWAHDFVEDRTRDGRKLRRAKVVDAFSRECLAIRRLNSPDVIDVLADLFILRGIAGHIRSDNGPEFVATAVRAHISGVGRQTAFIEPGSPWENG
jgi:putative transposase